MESLCVRDLGPAAAEGDESIPICGNTDPVSALAPGDLQVQVLRDVLVTYEDRVLRIVLLADPGDPATSVAYEKLQAVLLKIGFGKTWKAAGPSSP